MIVVALRGGLGNQLFQYAVGRHLAHLTNSELRLDLGWFGNTPDSNTKREYALHGFPIAGRPVTKAEGLWCAMHHGLLGRVPVPLPRRWRHIRERGFDFDERVLRLPGGAYLDGYWQSYRYFDGVAGAIRGEIMGGQVVSASGRRVAASVAEAGSRAVSLHVRRGDYISNAAAARHHGVCPAEYYQGAMRFISERIKDPVYFVFSDDIGWCRENLHFQDQVNFVIASADRPDEEDLLVMASCRHHIIANSSFSWWGAWLTPEAEDAIVVAPAKWFADGRATPTLLPGSWVRL
jgi:hypothetical protein